MSTDTADLQAAAMPASRWIARHFFTASGALVAELSSGIMPPDVFERLARQPHCLFLDSAAPDTADATGGDEAPGQTPPPRLGRHSFVAADPIHSLAVAADAPAAVMNALTALRALLSDLACATIPGLPPFQGGVAGLLSYECGLALAGISTPVADVPLLSLHAYDVVFGFDHDSGRGWIVSQGLPARGPDARRARARERLDRVLALLDEPPAAAASAAAPELRQIVSTRSREAYLDMVRAGIEFVRAGDIFQVNLAQRLSLAATVDLVDLARRSRAVNPAPFAACFRTGSADIVSMSPERLLHVERGVVRMHPIKGTRPVTASPEADLYAGADLGESAKDRAENVMIVDLVRNDLSRVCTPESVRVEALCRLERFRYVQHLVSIVAGRLRPGLRSLDALEAAIPGGSVTGAPKHRACEIIRDLEGFPRGAYCGSLGYLGFDGAADWNLLIRTFVVTPAAVSFAVGGGITARSDPAAEYEESLHKAEGMLRVLASFGDADGPAAAEGRS
jgi:para-aminobenzoate synthetase component 1